MLLPAIGGVAMLADVATELGLTRDAVDEIHRDYFVELERRAWADGILTEDERATLRDVGALLGLDDEAVAAAVDDVAPVAGKSPLPALLLALLTPRRLGSVRV